MVNSPPRASSFRIPLSSQRSIPTAFHMGARREIAIGKEGLNDCHQSQITQTEVQPSKHTSTKSSPSHVSTHNPHPSRFEPSFPPPLERLKSQPQYTPSQAENTSLFPSSTMLKHITPTFGDSSRTLSRQNKYIKSWQRWRRWLAIQES